MCAYQFYSNWKLILPKSTGGKSEMQEISLSVFKDSLLYELVVIFQVLTCVCVFVKSEPV